ncbi:hypothetical protein ABEB36_000158 [Hypothenemus hampei]|uniref:Regulatory protein zeste n=1 Tax=Hypothenemus hampei TaxID=57062 RepID=A0ABD1FAE4_HYPHA
MSCQINEKQSDNFFVEVKIIKKIINPLDEPTSSCAKKRAPNFSGEEETRLLELVTKYKNVIESRKTDAVNNKVKAETWDLITQEFNTKNDFPRMAKNLRANFAGERLTGFESSFDSDSHPKKRRSQEPSTSRDDDSVNVDSMEDSTEELLKDQRTDWSKCTPAQLKTPKSSSLMSHEKDKVKESGGKKTAKDKITLWALSKVELVELQKNSFLEEHKLKLKIMEDKAKKEMEVMERESRLRIEILELQKQKISSELSA